MNNHECYLIHLHSPLHPVLSGAKCLVEPVGQSLPEALVEVCQLKQSPERPRTLLIFYFSTLIVSITVFFLCDAASVWFLTFSVRTPCLCEWPAGSDTQGTGSSLEAAPSDPPSEIRFPSLRLPAIDEGKGGEMWWGEIMLSSKVKQSCQSLTRESNLW